MDDELAQELKRVELDAHIAILRDRAKSAGTIAKRGARIMWQAPIVLVPTFIGGMFSFAVLAIGGATAAALLSYGGVLLLFGSIAKRNALRTLRAHGGELPEARVVR